MRTQRKEIDLLKKKFEKCIHILPYFNILHLDNGERVKRIMKIKCSFIQAKIDFI